MSKATLVAAWVLAGWLLPAFVVGAGPQLAGPPSLQKLVDSGELPPVAARVPENPSIVSFKSPRRAGQYSEQMRFLMGKQKDIRMMMVYGYARLVAYDENLNLVPDILADIDIEDNRVFTFHLRKRHKWSDGYPFTSEDFRYYWEDVANNIDLSPFGPSRDLLVNQEPPNVEIIDEQTVRYSWSQPNPALLPALAGARPLFLYRPSHYLKQFHPLYTDEDELKVKMETAKKRKWTGLHHKKDNQYKSDNPDLPVLQPWSNSTSPPSERFVFERNPYFHRIDETGKQLPYIDRVVVNIADSKLVPAKTGAGDSDLQGRYLRFDNYTFLKAGEQRNDYAVRLWRTARGANIALYPNLNAEDPAWRPLLRDVRFRRALSLAINRREVNQVVYYGLASESNNTVLPQSPLFKEHYQKKWAQFDLDKANALLDELGLVRRDKRNVRLLPDGRPLELLVESAGESTEETDVLELVHDGWLRAGVKLYTRPSQREVLRNRVFAGEALMVVDSGLDNAMPTERMSPKELAPVEQVQYQWPKFGQFYETGGKAGTRADLPLVNELLRLYEEWRLAANEEQQRRIWERMLDIHADQVFTIGLINGVKQPVVVMNNLHNVPEEGVYSWDPGAYFGIYRPDTFWLEPAQ